MKGHAGNQQHSKTREKGQTKEEFVSFNEQKEEEEEEGDNKKKKKKNKGLNKNAYLLRICMNTLRIQVD